MPTYQFEAMDATGQEIRDEIDAANEEEAQTTIRQMGYFVTKISVKKQAAGQRPAQEGQETRLRDRRRQDQAHLRLHASACRFCKTPVCRFLRSLKILENNQKPGKLKNALMDVCDEIEGGSTLSEAMSKSPKVFSRLYVNMIKAGEAGGALETILQRLADFLERAESLKRKVKGALIYPVIVVMVAIGDFDVHHDLHRADVRKDVRGIRAEPAGTDAVADRDEQLHRRLLVLVDRDADLLVDFDQAAAQVPPRAGWALTCSSSRCRSSAA